MSYIGTPPSNAFTSLLKQDFSTSATTGYTLDHAVNNANDIALFINFVRQEPTAGYAASGTSLVLTSATASSDDMYCVYLGQALQTVNPANASVGLSQLTATGTKDATTFLRGDNTFASAGGTNTPAFLAFKTSVQDVSDNATTKVTFTSEKFDTDNTFASSKFTPAVSGKYFIYSQVGAYPLNNVGVDMTIKLYKNGSDIGEFRRGYASDAIQNNGVNALSISAVVDSDTNDYFEVYYKMNTSGGVNARIDYNSTGLMTFFGGYKIIE